MKLVLILVAWITAATPSPAQLVFGIENHASGSDRLVRIDLANSEITPVGYAGGTLFYTGLAFGADGDLYGTSMSTSFNYRGLRRIDIATGQATLIGMGGLPSGEFIHDLELNLVDDQVYGVGKSTGGSINLYTFDLTTGSASLAQTVSDPFGILPLGLGIDSTGRVFMFSSQPEDRMYEVVGGVLQPAPR